MEIRHLKYFVSAAKHLNFTKAAQECFVVQSAITQQIAVLEKELKVSLFERRGRKLALTQEGEVFLAQAKKLLLEIDRAVDLTQSVSLGYYETLRIGRQGNLLREELPQVLAALRKEQPQIKALMSQGTVPELTRALERGEVDCIITLSWAKFKLNDWMESAPLCENGVMVMVSADHPLASAGAVTMEQLRKEQFIQLEGHEKQNRLVQWAETGEPIKIYCWCDDHSSVEALVAAGYGVSICVRSACRSHDGLAYLPVLDMPQNEMVYLSFSKEQSEKPSLRAFHKKLKERLRDGQTFIVCD